MNDTQRKQLAHELAIEFIRANPNYLRDVKDNIPKMVDDFAEINKRFYDAMKNHEILDDLY